jgi:hypothetical protein
VCYTGASGQLHGHHMPVGDRRHVSLLAPHALWNGRRRHPRGLMRLMNAGPSPHPQPHVRKWRLLASVRAGVLCPAVCLAGRFASIAAAQSAVDKRQESRVALTPAVT